MRLRATSNNTPAIMKWTRATTSATTGHEVPSKCARPTTALTIRKTYPMTQSANAAITHATNINICSAAALDSCAASANRLSKNPATALSSPSALSSKPECPAGLRDRGLSLLISAALSKLAPEDQTQHEANSERCEYCFRWIFTDVPLGLFLERSQARPGLAPFLFRFAARFAPSLLRFSAVFFRESACG